MRFCKSKNEEAPVNTLYIDYTHSIPVKQTKVHGGANYTRSLLMNLLNYLEFNKETRKIIVLWPQGYLPTSDIERKIYSNDLWKIQTIEKLNGEVSFEPDSTLFIPLMGVKEFSVLKDLKNKKIKIVMTIHGLRLLDYKFDYYNTMYTQGFVKRIIALFHEIILPVKKFIYKRSLNKYLKYIDLVITVSNYTLAGLSKFRNVCDVLLQFEDANSFSNEKDECPEKYNDKYMLFVNGNRFEKNLARTLDAYKLYAKNAKNVIPLYIVGSSLSTRNALIKNLNLDNECRSQKIVFFDYVDDEKLISLYRHASFLLYTSKSEGFGLPALEAMKYGCPVVAAYGTSIPEILGSNCIYVNPYSVQSIKCGIEKMTDEKERNFYKSRVDCSYQNLIPRIQNSNNMVIKTLLDY